MNAYAFALTFFFVYWMRNIWQFLTENRFPEIKHSHDIWHAAKNLGKKIVAAGQNKECRELLEWSRDIVNHFWYSCSYATDVDSFMVSRYLFVLHLVYLLCFCSDWNWNMLITSFINPYAIRSYSKLICMLIAPFDFRRCGVGLSTMS